MGERFQGGEGFFRGKLEHVLMRLDDVKVEGHHPVEQSVIGRKGVGMLRVIVQALSERRDRFGHGNRLSLPFALSNYTAHRTSLQEVDQGLRPQSPSHALKRRGLRRAKAQYVRESGLMQEEAPLRSPSFRVIVGADYAVSKITTDYEIGLCAAMASSIIQFNF